jgi:hypothetical protein
MQKASRMLSEDIIGLHVVDKIIYMETLSKLVRALEALLSTE